MSATKRSRRRAARLIHVQKPNGVLHPRVQKVGPERFGVVAVDCAKRASKWMLADFYGNVLVPPTPALHTGVDLAAAVQAIRDAVREHSLVDLVVAVERTGDYHLPFQHACQKAKIETRIVHPFATSRFRQPVDPGQKTDDNDLAAIHLAAVNGLGLLEHALSPFDAQFRLLVRHRRDLVSKRSDVQCQMRHHLHLNMPGFADLFDDFFKLPAARFVAAKLGSAAVVRQTGANQLTQLLRDAAVTFRNATVDKILAWAALAGEPGDDFPARRRIYDALESDWDAKSEQIRRIEADLAANLVRTPYVLLLSVPGVNVVSAAEFAAEMGPVEHYASHRNITGRAGLFPSRYQSDNVDRPDGPILRSGNRRLRYAILAVADNLATCNIHFRELARAWKLAGKSPRRSRVKIASRFCRIAYHLVAGRTVFRHPCCQDNDTVLVKLLDFLRDHDVAMSQLLADLDAAVRQLPESQRDVEAKPLAQRLEKALARRSKQPSLLGEILPIVLARLLGEQVECNGAGN